MVFLLELNTPFRTIYISTNKIDMYNNHSI